MSNTERLLAEMLLCVKETKGRDAMIAELARLVEQERRS